MKNLFPKIECLICYENINPKIPKTNLYIFKCGHSVCKDCAEKTKKNNNFYCSFCTKTSKEI